MDRILSPELRQDVPNPHPEEIKASFAFRIGDHAVMEASARITPAGVISTGIAIAVVTLALGYVVGARRVRPRLRF